MTPWDLLAQGISDTVNIGSGWAQSIFNNNSAQAAASADRENENIIANRNREAMLQANEANLANQRFINAQNLSLTRESWGRDDNAIQRRTADLRAAGLNPLLAIGQAAGNSAPIAAGATADVKAYEQPQSRIRTPSMQAPTYKMDLMRLASASEQLRAQKLDNELRSSQLETERLRRVAMGQDYKKSLQDYVGGTLDNAIKTLELDFQNGTQEARKLQEGAKLAGMNLQNAAQSIENEYARAIKENQIEESKLRQISQRYDHILAFYDISAAQKDLLLKDYLIDEAKMNNYIQKKSGVPTNRATTEDERFLMWTIAAFGQDMTEEEKHNLYYKLSLDKNIPTVEDKSESIHLWGGGGSESTTTKSIR